MLEMERNKLPAAAVYRMPQSRMRVSSGNPTPFRCYPNTVCAIWHVILQSREGVASLLISRCSLTMDCGFWTVIRSLASRAQSWRARLDLLLNRPRGKLPDCSWNQREYKANGWCVQWGIESIEECSTRVWSIELCQYVVIWSIIGEDTVDAFFKYLYGS